MSSIATDAPVLLAGGIRTTAKGRMAWKEFRQNLPPLIIFVVGMLIMLVITSQIDRPTNQAYWIGPVWILTNIFALTIGIFLFAPEKENRTIDMLGHLPISSWFAVGAKLWAGLVAIIVFFLIGVLLCIFEVVVLGATFEMAPSAEIRASVVCWIGYIGLFAPLECFLWGALCSMMSKRAIFAVVFASGCVLLAWWIPTMAAVWFYSEALGFIAFAITKGLVYLALVIQLASAGARWLGNSPRAARATAIEPDQVKNFIAKDVVHSNEATGELGLTNQSHSKYPKPGRVYSSLIWQSISQYRTVLRWALGCVVPFALIAGLIFAASNGAPSPEVLLFMITTPFLIIVSIGSLFVFSQDHANSSYRFFQQHREHGRKLWLSRLLPAGLLALACAVILFLIIFLLSDHLFWIPAQSIPLDPLVFGFSWQSAIFSLAISFFTLYAIGQFCSMFFRSGVYSFLFMLTMIGFAGVWIMWLVYLGAGWQFLLPVPIAMLAITWWRAPRWLADRNQVSDYVIPWMALGMIASATVVSFIYHRYASIPQLDLEAWNQVMVDSYTENFDSQKDLVQYERPRLFQEAAKNARISDSQMARSMTNASSFMMAGFLNIDTEPKARSKHEFKQALDDFLERNRLSMDLIHQTDDLRTFGSTMDRSSVKFRFNQIAKLRILIAAEAHQHELDGDLEQSLTSWLRLQRFDREYPLRSTVQASVADCLIHWSRLPNQDVALIKQGIAALNWDKQKWMRQAIWESHFNLLDFENWIGEYIATKGAPDSTLANQIIARMRFPLYMPWEVERCRRITRNRIAGSVGIQGSFSRFATDSELDYKQVWGTDFPLAIHMPVAQQPDYSQPEGPELFWVKGYGDFINASKILKKIQSSRYAQVQMGLAAWRVDHAQYPERLDQLVPDYLDKLPVDVFYGGQFAFAPHGRDAKVNWNVVSPRRRYVNGLDLGSNEKEETLVERFFFNKLLDSKTPFLLPWSTSQPQSLDTFRIRDNQQAFQCYDYSDPRDYLCYLFRNTEFFELPPGAEVNNE